MHLIPAFLHDLEYCRRTEMNYNFIYFGQESSAAGLCSVMNGTLGFHQPYPDHYPSDNSRSADLLSPERYRMICRAKKSTWGVPHPLFHMATGLQLLKCSNTPL